MSIVILYLRILIDFIALCVFFAFREQFKIDGNSGNSSVNYEMVILMLLCIESMFLLLSMHDFFCMYLVIELQSIGFYILAASKRYSRLSSEAGLKYFL